ncbi:hypothetical protein ACXR0O_23410 [Verrucomicrobiota bacterium sgz303538]
MCQNCGPKCLKRLLVGKDLDITPDRVRVNPDVWRLNVQIWHYPKQNTRIQQKGCQSHWSHMPAAHC